MKSCTKCKEVKELASFYKDRTKKDGYSFQCKACKLEYRKSNREKINTQKQQYYQSRKDWYSEYYKEYNKTNRDAVLAQKKIYHEKNKSTRLDKYNGRRVKKAGGKVEYSSLTEALYIMARTLSNTCEPMHVDHIIPVSEGGDHTFENLQILTASDNIKKNNKIQ